MDQLESPLAEAKALMSLLQADLKTQEDMFLFQCSASMPQAQKSVLEAQKLIEWRTRAINCLNSIDVGGLTAQDFTIPTEARRTELIQSELKDFEQSLEDRGMITKPYEIETEKDVKTGQQKVKLQQKIPSNMKALREDNAWFLQLLNTHFKLQNQNYDEIVRVEQLELINLKGVNNPVYLYLVHYKSGKTPKKYVFLMTKEDENSSKNSQLYRESNFYHEWAGEIQQRIDDEPNVQGKLQIPETYISVVDPSTGRNFILMEYLEDSQGLSFAFDSVDKKRFSHIFGDDLSPDAAIQMVMKQVAEQFALMHGAYWMDKEALQRDKNLLRSAAWILGEDSNKLTDQVGELDGLKDFLNGYWTQENKDQYPNAWKVTECIQKVFDAKKHQADLQDESFNWTLVHGDAWANNIVWSKSKKQVTMTDFEWFGFSNPTMDLCIFLLHMPCELRKAHQKEFLEIYHQILSKCKRVPQSYTFEKMMEDLKTIGFGRFFAYMCGWCFVRGEQGFKDMIKSVEHFVIDFEIDGTKLKCPPYGWW